MAGKLKERKCGIAAGSRDLGGKGGTKYYGAGTDPNGANLRIIWAKIMLDCVRVGAFFAH
jgi:hypothetical protein